MLFFRGLVPQVFSPQRVLTTVFGMGTGGTPAPETPETGFPRFAFYGHSSLGQFLQQPRYIPVQGFLCTFLFFKSCCLRVFDNHLLIYLLLFRGVRRVLLHDFDSSNTSACYTLRANPLYIEVLCFRKNLASSPRPIATDSLNALLHVHVPRHNRVVFPGSY